MKKTIKYVILFAILIALGYGIYAKFIKKEEKIEFITTNAKIGNITQSVEATGKIYPKDSVDLGAQVSGQIKKLYVEIGDVVKKGDMIAEIDDIKQKNKIDDLKASLNIYKAKLNSANIAREVSENKYKRELNLYKSNATSKESLEKAKDELSLAKASLAEIQEQIKKTEISLYTAQTDLGYTKIVSSLDGVVISIPVKEGQTVNAAQTTPTIAKIADLNTLEVRVEVPEGDINSIKVGQKVKFGTLGDINLDYNATIVSIDPADKTYSDESSSSLKSGSSSASSSNSAVYYYAKYYIKNENNYFKIGMTIENSIIINNAKNVLIIPSITIKNDENSHFVLLKDEQNGVKKVNVEVGLSDGINTQIISGLKEGDEVITNKLSSKELENLNKNRKMKIR